MLYQPMRALVIVPTYNEAHNLPPLVAEIAAVIEADILVVDDSSPDGTGQIADDLSRASAGRLKVIHRSRKRGLGTAYVAGFRYALAAGYECVMQMDADFSHRPCDLPRLLEASRVADVVIGSRSVPGGATANRSLLRRLVTYCGSLYARQLLDLPLRDCTSGFKCLSRRVLETIDWGQLQSNGFAFQIEVNYACHRAGLRFVEIPVIFPERIAGASKMSLGIALEAAMLGLRLRLGSSSALSSPPSAPGYRTSANSSV